MTAQEAELEDSSRAKKPQKKKKGLAALAQRRPKTVYGIGGFVTFVTLVVWWGIQPMRGPIEVGVCRTYAELMLNYPQTFQITTYEQFERSVRLHYTYRGAFGERRSNIIDCRFTPPGSFAFPQLEQVQINRIIQPKDKVNKFNFSIPSLIEAEPNLVVPFPYDGTFEDLKRD